MAPAQIKRSLIITDGHEYFDPVHQWLVARSGIDYLGLRQIDDYYFDTKSYDLFRSGYVCCLRESGGQAALCIIPVSQFAVSRPERRHFSQIIPGAEIFGRLHIAALAEGEVKSHLVSLFGNGILRQIFRVRIVRNSYSMTHSAASGGVSLDQVVIHRTASKSDEAVRLRYSEMVLLSGAHHAAVPLESLHSELLRQFPFQPANSNPFRRALQVDGTLEQHFIKTQLKPLGNLSSGHEIFRTHMLNQLKLIQFWEPTALEGSDIEGVHQMRVAIRRIRSALKTFSPLLMKADIRRWQDEFRWLGSRLGTVRDLDVFHEWLSEQQEQAREEDKDYFSVYKEDIDQLRLQTRMGLIGSLESDRYRLLLEHFKDWVMQEQCFFVHAELTYSQPKTLARKLLRDGVHRVTKKISRLKPESAVEKLHGFRIECKRLRYSVDLLGDASRRDYQPVLELCKNMQTTLGEHQDLCERVKRIAAYADSETATDHGHDYIFFLGRLHSAQENLIADYHRQFFAERKQTEKRLKQFL